jgi:hypothetical protein
VVADGHPLSALAADHQALQQRGSLAGGAGAALLPAGGGVGGERGLVALVLLEGDVPGVRVFDQHGPLIARLVHGAAVPVDAGDLAASAVEVGAGVTRVVQHEQRLVVAQRLPVQLAGVRPAGGVVAGERQLLRCERLDHRRCRTGRLERLEQVGERLAHAGVGIERDSAGGVIDQPDGQAHGELPAPGLGEQSALQSGADEVQLGLGDRALEAQQQPVVDRAWVIEAVLVADQRV